MRLAALMMVRNEADIVADSVGHLLHGIGVDRIYVTDNGSADATLGILRRLAALDPRVHVRVAPGAFRQSEIMNEMVAEAVADGADWLLPNDADEFLWCDGPALRAQCAAAVGLSGFQLQVRNFVQFRSVARDRPGSIATMAYSAEATGGVGDAQSLVTFAGLPFVQSRYPAKLLLRATRSLRIRRGQHEADGLDGPCAAAPLEILHAPIRSRDDLNGRVAHGRRLLQVSADPRAGWHLKRLVGMDAAALDAEWRSNSVGLEWPKRGLRLDPRLCWLAWRLRGFRRAVFGSRLSLKSRASGALSSQAGLTP